MKDIKKILLWLLLLCFLGIGIASGFQLIGSGGVAAGGGSPLTIVQAKTATATSSAASSLTPDLLSTPTSGSLLTVEVTTGADDTFSTPSGWTKIFDTDGAGTVGAAWFYKVSDGTEQTVTVEWTGSVPCRAIYTEWGGWSSTPTLEVSQEDESHIDAGNETTSQSTGTTSSTTSTYTWALAFFGAEIGQNFDTGLNYTNSFVEIETQGAASSSRPIIILAGKSLSSTGTVECTVSTTDVGDSVFGSVAVFRDGS